jgi:DNA-binding transcriptional regulator of glucitol operon
VHELTDISLDAAGWRPLIIFIVIPFLLAPFAARLWRWSRWRRGLGRLRSC